MQPSQIASRLGLEDFKDLAFVISRKASITLPKAIRLAKKPLKDSATRAFEKGYDISLSYSERMTTSKMSFGANVSIGQYLDPRISEVASQSPLPSFIFLPFLIDDPSRASAWKVSRKLRIFAYSLFNFRDPETRLDEISEYGRRGNRITEDHVTLFSMMKTLTFANALTGTLDSCKRLFSHLPEDGIWRIYALREVVNWYIDEEKEPPSNTAMIRVLLGAAKAHLSWNDIHLSAQIQAVLYSLRMIAQILNHLKAETNPASPTAQTSQNAQAKTYTDPNLSPPRLSIPSSPTPFPTELVALSSTLAPLPPLHALLPSRTDLSPRAHPPPDPDHLLSILAASLPGPAEATGAMQRTSTEDVGPVAWTETKERGGRKAGEGRWEAGAGARAGNGAAHEDW